MNFPTFDFKDPKMSVMRLSSPSALTKMQGIAVLDEGDEPAEVSSTPCFRGRPEVPLKYFILSFRPSHRNSLNKKVHKHNEFSVMCN